MGSCSELAKRAMAKSNNNKGKPAGSGTVSNARREMYKKACQERDKFLEALTNLEKSKGAPKGPPEKTSGGMGLYLSWR